LSPRSPHPGEVRAGKDEEMNESQTRLSEAVEQLAVQTIMVEPDDVMTLGAMLEQLESIETLGPDQALTPILRVAESLKKAVEKVILKEFPDAQEGLTILGEGVKLIQQLMSRPEELHPTPAEESFWKKWESLTGEKRVLPVDDGRKGPAMEQNALPQDRELFNDFISEALEHLGTIELNIMNLEQSPDDKECINTIFRPFHTLKGVSGFLNLLDINRFSHAMESLLDKARNHQLTLHPAMIDFILEAVDLLKEMILDLKTHVEQGQFTHATFDLEPYFEKIGFFEKGGFLEEEGTAPKASPADTGGAPLGKILSARGIVSEREIDEALEKQAASKGTQKIGEILVQESKAKPKEVVDALREQKRLSSQFAEATVKVDMTKLDNLVDLVGELVIAQSLVQQNPVFPAINDQKMIRDFSQLKRITTDLQKISMTLRMVPIRQTFQKMIRLVRDLAKKSGKEVNLIMSGEETEIDRNMVDALYEPLVHMIRNAVDHGIEMPPKRMEAGKPETGQILLKAYQKGGHVVVEIEDDGQGLNRAKIVQKAKGKGLLPEDAQLTDHRIDNLIFEPGFSTADQITDVSGRGVGMDVVKKTIERLKGKVEIFSTEGKGSRFVIRVPLTLAIVDGIVIQVGEERYIVPTVFIKETLRPHPEEISTVQKKGDLVKVRNSLIPLIRLHSLLGVVPRKREPWEALVIVVENEGRQKCLMVDDLIGKQEVVIKNLGEKLNRVRGVAGATIMGDGRVGLILDIHGIFEIDQMN
jgi:two-component system, chemotaxis family, sensor kinase CheA